MLKVFRIWIPLAVAVLLMGGLAYVASQQVYRQSANDPQVQISEDVAGILAAGQDPAALEGETKIDIGKSLSTFIVILGEDGKVISSNAVLDNQVPQIPKGALDAAKAKGSNKLTWMPSGGHRYAAVITPYGGDKPGYVLVGRSLREVESRVHQLTALIGLGILVSWVILLIVIVAVQNAHKMKHLRRKKHEESHQPPVDTIA